MDNRYNRHNRRKYSLKVHIVLVTKYRKQLLKGTLLTMLNKRFLIYVNLKNGKSLLWRLTKTISIFSQNTMQLTGYVILLRLSSRKLRIICGENTKVFFLNSIGKRKTFGLTAILLAVQVRYHQLPYKNIQNLKYRRSVAPPTT